MIKNKLPLRCATLIAMLVALNMTGVHANNHKNHTNYPDAIVGAPVNKTFPTSGGTPEASWSFNWVIPKGKGLELQDVMFQPSPTATFKHVLFEAAANEILVVPHDGNVSALELSNSSKFTRLELTDAECDGTLLADANGGKNYVCMQLKDRGLAWRTGTAAATDQTARRGEELVLWSALSATNFNYVFEWTFRDDGVIKARIGIAGENAEAISGGALNYNAFWRLDFDMNGSGNDTAYINRHSESTNRNEASDAEDLISFETGIEWNPYEFNTLVVRDATQENTHMINSSYRIIPGKTGVSRHQLPYTQNDFWVLNYDAAELDVTKLQSYSNNANVMNQDIVVWYMDTFHQTRQGEEGTHDENGVYTPIAKQLEWISFMIKPHDVFDKSPLPPPPLQ